MTTVDTLQSSLVYAERYNWHVMPTNWVRADGSCSCGDPHLDNRGSIGKHPLTALVPNGLKDATTNPDVIRSWWEAAPEANVAVVCQPSGLVVLDIDPRHDGDTAWANICSQVDVPETLWAKTGGGGWHFFFRAKPGVRYRGQIARGVDVKHNGYVLVSPSNHVQGEYSWASTGLGPQELGALAGLVEIGQAQSLHGLDLSGSVLDFDELFAGVPEGQRHDTFKSWCASMRSRRLKYPEAKTLLEVAVAAAEGGQHAFTMAEALPILNWAYTELKEGSSAEQEIEGYKGFLDHMAAQQLAANDGQLNGITPHATIVDRINALPDVLKDGVIEELRRRDIRLATQQIINAVEFHPPEGVRLDELLARGVPDPVWTVTGLHEVGTNMTLTAQYKTGKTTLQLNLMKALADEEMFLGQFPTHFPTGTIAFFNYELTEAQFIRWAMRMGVIHPERVHVLNMRGVKLDIGDDHVQRWVIEWLASRDVKYWFVDPLARAYYGDENDNTQLKLWTDALDYIKRESGVTDVLVSLHTGRGEQEEGQERARGATRIDDWADGRWVLTRQGDHRFFRADGREVELPETMLVFNPEQHHLAVSNLTPIDRRTAAGLDGIQHVVSALQALGAVSQDTAVTQSQLRDAIRQGRISDRGKWIAAAVNSGGISQAPGPRTGVVLWYEG